MKKSNYEEECEGMKDIINFFDKIIEEIKELKSETIQIIADIKELKLELIDLQKKKKKEVKV